MIIPTNKASFVLKTKISKRSIILKKITKCLIFLLLFAALAGHFFHLNLWESLKDSVESGDRSNLRHWLSIQSRLEDLEDENTSYLKKVTFMDRFVVFVENDGSNLYHTYNCSRFKKEDFWVFNPSYAKNQGYSECPNCH